MIIYPNRIKRGDTIGVTATSKGAFEQGELNKLENAYKNFLELGYNHIETDNARKNHKFVSSDGKTRAKEFMDLWKNKDINWIMPVTGRRILDGDITVHRYRDNKK